MSYVEEWKALSAWIRGLQQAGELYGQFIGGRSDVYGGGDKLRVEVQAVVEGLHALRGVYNHMLPARVVSALDDFTKGNDLLLRDSTGSSEQRQNRTWVVLTALVSLEARVSFLLSDTQEAIHAKSERAFLHLQRSIIVDVEVREKWKQAFGDGEVACERLGSVHLLLHAIWAFKVHAGGARTDLVMQEPLAELSGQERYSDGLVLTEWKKANSLGDLPILFEKARVQAQRYAAGPLAATELKDYRYLIVVSQRSAEIRSDVKSDGVTYRHINIAVDPQVPSRG